MEGLEGVVDNDHGMSIKNLNIDGGGKSVMKSSNIGLFVDQSIRQTLNYTHFQGLK